MKKFLSSFVIVVGVFLCSAGTFAEDSVDMSWENAMLEATAWVVDQDNNAITLVSPDEINDVNVNVFERYSDVAENAWYQKFVSHLTQLGVVQGVSQNEFAPQRNVTRAEFATMLALADEADLSIYQGISSFQDVSENAWYAPQIEWAYQQGLIEGFENSLFYPNDCLTREQAATIIDRYAEAKNSRILEMNRYELNESVCATLSTSEVEYIEELIAAPEYLDQSNISDWAEYSVTEMSQSGIFCGDGSGDFNPQNYITRAECAKLISAYIIFDSTPTFYFPGGSYIEYLRPTTAQLDEEAQIEANSSEGTEHGPLINIETTVANSDPGRVSTSWKKVTHKAVTDLAFDLLKQNTGNGDRTYIYNKLGETINFEGRNFIGSSVLKEYAWYTDSIENQNNKFYAHFYDPDTGKSYGGSTSVNAYWFFNNHYYNAYTSYLSKNKYYAYKEIGMSIHYLEDLNTPYHAANVISNGPGSRHYDYEDWVNDFAANYSTNMTYSAYRFVYDSSFLDMAKNFAGLAKDSYSRCNLFDHSNSKYRESAQNATITNLNRTERAVCGLLNRFYYNSCMSN